MSGASAIIFDIFKLKIKVAIRLQITVEVVNVHLLFQYNFYLSCLVYELLTFESFNNSDSINWRLDNVIQVVSDPFALMNVLQDSLLRLIFFNSSSYKRTPFLHVLI